MTWAAFVTWWSNNAVVRWITYIVLFLIGWEAVKRHLKQAGRDAERQAIERKQAEVKAAVVVRQSEIIEEESTHADQAIRARDREHPATTFDELPDEVQRVLDRSARGREAS